jgi:hypothetical protein
MVNFFSFVSWQWHWGLGKVYCTLISGNRQFHWTSLVPKHHQQGTHPHISDRPYDLSSKLGHLCHLDCRYHSRNQKLHPRSGYIEWGIYFFCVGTMRRICISRDDFYSDKILVQGVIKYGVFNILIFCLSSRRWFMLWLACIHYLVVVQVSGDRD